MRRGGFVMPLALVVLVAISFLAVTAVQLAVTDFRANRGTRIAHRAFHPNGSQQVLSIHPALFTLLRTSPEGDKSLLCVHNVSNAEQSVSVNLANFSHSGQVRDIITGATLPAGASGELSLSVAPYQTLWLTAKVT